MNFSLRVKGNNKKTDVTDKISCLLNLLYAQSHQGVNEPTRISSSDASSCITDGVLFTTVHSSSSASSLLTNDKEEQLDSLSSSVITETIFKSLILSVQDGHPCSTWSYTIVPTPKYTHSQICEIDQAHLSYYTWEEFL